MKKLIIKNINNYEYILKDIDNNEYQFDIEFYHIGKNPKVGDCLFIAEKILKENNAVLNFDVLESRYGRKITRADDEDIAVLIINEEKIYLKRVYG